MDFYDENKINAMKPTSTEGGMMMVMGMAESERKVCENNRVKTRKPLGLICQNTVGGGGRLQPNPSAFNKRSLKHGVNEASKKIPPIPSHRPLTRNLAAKIAPSAKKLSSQEKRKHRTPWDSFGVWEEGAPYVEEHEPVPMSLEKRKETSHENDHMEVEMEDIFEESILDIDTCDVKNPLAATEYLDDLYAYYRKVEGSSCISPKYMENQFDINSKMRAILIDWLVEVNYKFELRDETLFLTVNLIDRFLEKHHNLERKKLQLVGLVAMLLACKYEEVSVPILDDFIFISDKAYTRKEILEMENVMVNALQFNMSLPTAYVFLTRYLKAAQSDKKLELLSFFLIELCLVEIEMVQFPPSFLASAAIYTAQRTLYGASQWNKTLEWHTKYSEDQLLECSRMIASFHQKAATGKLTGVHRKYNTSKFGFAAKCEPAKCLLSS